MLGAEFVLQIRGKDAFCICHSGADLCAMRKWAPRLCALFAFAGGQRGRGCLLHLPLRRRPLCHEEMDFKVVCVVCLCRQTKGARMSFASATQVQTSVP